MSARYGEGFRKPLDPFTGEPIAGAPLVGVPSTGRPYGNGYVIIEPEEPAPPPTGSATPERRKTP